MPISEINSVDDHVTTENELSRRGSNCCVKGGMKAISNRLHNGMRQCFIEFAFVELHRTNYITDDLVDAFHKSIRLRAFDGCWLGSHSITVEELHKLG